MSAITWCSATTPGTVNFHRVRMILVCLARTWRLTTVDFTATTLTRPVPIAARLACINSICSRAICRLRCCNWFILESFLDCPCALVTVISSALHFRRQGVLGPAVWAIKHSIARIDSLFVFSGEKFHLWIDIFIWCFHLIVLGSTNSGHKDRSNEDRRRILGGIPNEDILAVVP